MKSYALSLKGKQYHWCYQNEHQMERAKGYTLPLKGKRTCLGIKGQELRKTICEKL